MILILDTSDAIQLVVLVILLMLSAFFSSAETALTCVNKVKMKTLAEEGSKNAGRVLRILESPGKMLSTILIGNNLVNITTTSMATALTIKLFGSVFVGLVTCLLTILVLLFGEIVPKTAANINPEKLALTYSPIIQALMFILTPVIFIVDKMSAFFLKLMHINANVASG